MRRRTALLGSGGAALLTLALVTAPAGAAPAARTDIPGSTPSVQSRADLVGSVPAATPESFDVALQLPDPAAAAAEAQAVSDPTSPSYRHYLTTAQWVAGYAPTAAQVGAVTSWLESTGLQVGAVAPDHLTVAVSGTAAQAAAAFGTTLNTYKVNGRAVQLSSGALSVPSSVAGLVAGTVGLNQIAATPDTTNGADTPAAAPAPATTPIPQPDGFRNAKPCSASYGSTLDTTDPAYGGGFPSPLPYAVCGYTPPQLQSAYGLSGELAGGTTGRGVTVAILDAYASPTLYTDAHRYSLLNQTSAVLTPGQFSEQLSPTFDHVDLCQASGWFGEQTLDVEAVHTTAPGAHILYVGARNCLGGLFDSLQHIVDTGAAQVVTDSWGDDAGDLLDSAGDRAAYDNVFQLAISTGISVLFSAGDNGDEFATTGLTTPDYPPSSPWVTAVGGTSLQVGSAGQRLGERGWSTSKSDLCTAALTGQLPGCTATTVGTWIPAAPGGYDYGGGGGTSYNYAEPWYQKPVVPQGLSLRNYGVTGVQNRVEPDISMDADPTTGMLVGETQIFPNGTYYSQYRIGGTSLSSPLFAGVVALADQQAGAAVGFVNPTLYALEAHNPSVLYDVVPGHKEANVRNDYVNGINPAFGIITSARVLTYEGVEEYCDGVGSCSARQAALTTAPGFDSMTGVGTPGTDFTGALASP
jgi:subtilase family serine protease